MAGYPSRISFTLISSCFVALGLIWYSRKRAFSFLQRSVKDFGPFRNSPEINSLGEKKAVDACASSMNLKEHHHQEAGLAQQIPCRSETTVTGTMHLKDKSQESDCIIDSVLKEDTGNAELNGSAMKKTCKGNHHDGANGATCDSVIRTNEVTTNGTSPCDNASDKKVCSVPGESGEYCEPKANGCEIIHESNVSETVHRTNGHEAVHEANGCKTVSSLTNGVDTLCLDECVIVSQDMPNGQIIANGDTAVFKSKTTSQTPECINELPHAMSISADTCIIAELSTSSDNLPPLADATDRNSDELSCQIDFDRKSSTPDSGVSAELECQSPCSTLSEPHSESLLDHAESLKSPAVSEMVALMQKSSNYCGNGSQDGSCDDGAIPSCSYDIKGATASCHYVEGTTASCSYDADGATASCSYDVDGATASCSYDFDGATASCSYDVDGATASCSYDVDGATASCSYDDGATACSYDVDGATASCSYDDGATACSYDVDGATASCSYNVDCATASCSYDVPVSGDDGQMDYDFEIPPKLCGYLIGRGGRNVKYLCEASNATITINGHPILDNIKLCRVTGTEEEIKSALVLIRKKFPLDDYPILTLESINPLQTECTLPVTIRLSLPPGVNFDVILSSMVTPSHIFLQQPTHPTYHSLMWLTKAMTTWYKQYETPKIFNVTIDHVVVVPLSDGWYRAQVVDIFPETEECAVKFLDFGGYSTVPMDQLRQIRMEFAYVPFQAVECYVGNITYPEGETEWSDEAKAFFEKLAIGQVIHGYISAYDGDIPVVHLYRVQEQKTIYINRELVAAGLARWIEQNS